MPSTVNGIGTHYYGKKNRSVRQGVCNACHRQVQLESYDTRLFFVFVFIQDLVFVFVLPPHPRPLTPMPVR